MKRHLKAQHMYKQTSILSAPTETLIIELIDKALLTIDMARSAIEKKDLVTQNGKIQVAQECMLQLILFFGDKAEEGKKLIAVYDYLNRQLIKANMNSDLKLLEEVTIFLHSQKEDWQIALKNRRKMYKGDLI